MPDDLQPARSPYHRARHAAQEKGCTCQWWGDKHIAEFDLECLIPEHRGEARFYELEDQRDEQLVTDILVAIDQTLLDHGRYPLDIIDGPTVDSLRWAVQRELEPLEVELSRLRAALDDTSGGAA